MAIRRTAAWSAASALALVAALTAGPVASTVGARSAAVGAPSAVTSTDEVRLNEVQVVGSHNSYKRMPSAAEIDVLRSFIGGAVDALSYQHEPLPVQFQSQKVRQIELDVFVDSAGGLYSDPLLRSAAGVGPYDPAMDAPGLKVLHVQDVDYATTCLTLIDCLEQIEAWSDANPSHLPIAVLVEMKQDPLSFGDFTFTTPEPWTQAAMADLDAEIRSVMDPDDLVTPDDVRGSFGTVNEAILTDGWPTIGETRGKVMFLMDNGGGFRTDYLAGNPNLEGRVLFTNASPGDPDAAFIKRNDPFAADIEALVAAGYVVRTRSDAETAEARSNDTGPRDRALASGAQWVSTDYPVPNFGFGFATDFVVEIPGGTVARCNPINGPEGCVSAELDTIFTPYVPPAPVPPTTPEVPVTTVPGQVGPDGRDPDEAPGATPISGAASYTG